MKTLKETVWHEIRQNPSIRIDLTAGLINTRALAKHIKKRINTNASLDAIISAIRRYEEDEKLTSLKEDARKAVKDSTISSKNHVAAITLHRNESVVSSLPEIFNKIKLVNHGMLRVVHAQRSMKIYLDQEFLKEISLIFTKNDVINKEKHLGEVTVNLNRAEWDTPGVLNTLTTELALNNINITEAISCIPEIVFILKEKDLMKAYEALYHLANK